MNSWKSSTGAIRSSEIYHGETTDARLEKKGWNTLIYNDADWSGVKAVSFNNSNLVVIRHPKRHPANRQASMALPTRPHAIFSTLQGTQNPDTKPTLQRVENANAQPTHPG